MQKESRQRWWNWHQCRSSFDQVRPVLDIVNILTSKTIQVLPGDIIADVRFWSVHNPVGRLDVVSISGAGLGSHIPEVLLQMGGSKVCREKVL